MLLTLGLMALSGSLALSGPVKQNLNFPSSQYANISEAYFDEEDDSNIYDILLPLNDKFFPVFTDFIQMFSSTMYVLYTDDSLNNYLSFNHLSLGGDSYHISFIKSSSPVYELTYRNGNYYLTYSDSYNPYNDYYYVDSITDWDMENINGVFGSSAMINRYKMFKTLFTSYKLNPFSFSLDSFNPFGVVGGDLFGSHGEPYESGRWPSLYNGKAMIRYLPTTIWDNNGSYTQTLFTGRFINDGVMFYGFGFTLKQWSTIDGNLLVHRNDGSLDFPIFVGDSGNEANYGILWNVYFFTDISLSNKVIVYSVVHDTNMAGNTEGYIIDSYTVVPVFGGLNNGFEVWYPSLNNVVYIIDKSTLTLYPTGFQLYNSEAIYNSSSLYITGVGGGDRIYDGIDLIYVSLTGIAGLFSIAILPGITFGTLLFIPLTVTIIIVVVRLVKK